MKRSFLFTAALFVMFLTSGVLKAQTEGSPLQYTEVEQVEGIEAAELFARAQTWLAQSYNSGKHVLQMADNNRLVGKANHTYTYQGGGLYGRAKCRIEYTLTIECRDGRYKYTIDNIQLFVRPTYNPNLDEQDWGLLTDVESLPKMSAWKTNIPNKHRQGIWRKSQEQMNEYAILLATSLKIEMAKSTTDNDW